jgi:gliding motility-associated-like protein
MKKIYIILICLIITPVITNAQNEGNFWYFGFKAGIDFNSGVPVAVTNGAMNTQEGCATISDNLGNLLFYTDGTRVWGSNHFWMPNSVGLFGNSSSTQSAVIVKEPGSNTIYYIFTVAMGGQANGLSYSVVDMSLQGGLGDVTLKNIPITTPTTENICAIRHQNGTDFWIVTHAYNGSNTYLSFLLTSTGVNLTPVTSNAGVNVTPNGPSAYNSIGYLKASQDGSRIAAARLGLNTLDILDFNKATGVLSNAMNFSGFNGGPNSGPYGVEFSPNGNLLYVGELNAAGNSIYQFNLLAGSQAAINSSRITIATPTGLGGALQLGPDQKIYHTLWGVSALSVINSPNTLGLGCNYVQNSLSLPAALGHQAYFGLPTFVNSFNVFPGFTFTNLCFGDSTSFTINSSNPIDSVQWNFGDPASGINNTSLDSNPVHLYTDTGSFTITLITYNNGIPDTIINQLTITPLPIVYLGPDTSLCQGQQLILDATTPSASYLWQDSSTNATLNVTSNGTYWVEVTVNNCSSTDTINVTFNPSPIVDIGNDTVLCLGQPLTLNATTSNATYLWQDNSTNPTFNVNQQGSYWVEVTVNNCSTNDTIVVTYYNPIINLGLDTSLCIGQGLLLNASLPNAASYLWQDNSINATFNVTSAGTYFVEVTTLNNCSVSDTIEVTFTTGPSINLGNDLTMCDGDAIVLNATFPNSTYVWQDNSTSNVLSVDQPGSYWVIVTNNCGFTSDTVVVSLEFCEVSLIMPNVFTPNNDNHNDFFVPVKMEGIDEANVIIFNRWGQQLYETNNLLTGWNGRTPSGESVPEGTYFWIVNYTDSNQETNVLKGTVSLLK